MEGPHPEEGRDKAKIPRMVEGCQAGTMVTSTPAHQSVARVRHDSEMDSGYTTATPTVDSPYKSFRDPRHHPASFSIASSSSSSSTPCSSLFYQKFTPIPVSPLHADWNVQEEELRADTKLQDSQVSHDSGNAYDSHDSQNTSASHHVSDSQDTPDSQDSCIGSSISGAANSQEKLTAFDSSPSCQAASLLQPVKLVSKFKDRGEEDGSVDTEKPELPEKVPGTSVSAHSARPVLPSSPQKYDKQNLLMSGRVIGALMGIGRLDIIGNLDAMGIPFLGGVFGYLEPKDVCSFSCVCKTWQCLVRESKVALPKRKLYIAQVQAALETKENSGKTPVQSQCMTISMHVMGSVQLAGSTPPPRPPTTDPTTRTEIFQQAASTLTKEESLRQCPRCFLPSKVYPDVYRASCLSSKCGYEFCAKCLNEFHPDKPCPNLLPKATAGCTLTKKSKKNLKRL